MAKKKRTTPSPNNRVISWRKIREFLAAHPEDPSAQAAFIRWYDAIRNNPFAGYHDVRRLFPSADLVGDLVVFNIRGNNYRVAARFVYDKRRIYIRRVMTHAEYDRGDWKE